MQVRKKSGRVESYDTLKIIRAVEAASYGKVSKAFVERVSANVDRTVMQVFSETGLVSTEDLHNLVEDELRVGDSDVYSQYATYRKFKKQMGQSFDAARHASEKIMIDGDRENANKDSALNSTKQTLIAESFMKQLMINFELEPQWVEAHRDGWIWIHDLSSRFLRQHNCCLFDMGEVLRGGFRMNGAEYLEPKSVATALAVMGDVTLQASAQQYGGFTIPEIDTILAPYAERSFQKHLKNERKFLEGLVDEDIIVRKAREETVREITQGVQGFETKLNTVSSSLGQVPFVCCTFGLNSSEWGKEISRALLNNRIRGMGKKKTTAVFPKLVMLMRKEINRDADSPNRDLYDLAVTCSKTRLYPDYLSLDNAEGGNNLAEIYERSGQAVSPMGCRAYLSPYWDNNEEIYTGRGNLGAVSLNLPKMAIEAKGDISKFYSMIDKYAEMVWRIHLANIEKVGKQRGSTNPLFYCEGGAWKQVGYDDEIAPVIESFTSSLGYIGLQEAVSALTGNPLLNNQELGLEIVQHLKNLVNDATNRYGKLFALYSTPAESLCYSFQKHNRETYGEISNVSDREYMTNSFHIPVWENVTVPQKIAFEAPFHKVATGGRISYCEFPYGTQENVLQQAIDFAMDSGEYFGVNIVSSSCLECGYNGDFEESCPKCDASGEQIVSVLRVCGYLSFASAPGEKESRYNPGKKAEVRDRVKHFSFSSKTNEKSCEN